MKYLVAVSGGIDSVVLLDMLVAEGDHELVIAHFDHGIRTDSAADARFVGALATQYGLQYVQRREELGSGASEGLARARRYAFLFDEAARHGAQLATAHHADDVLETMAINLIRGTGWRGMAVLDTPRVVRPLLAHTKQQILQYALKHRLEWVEDSTNSTDAYLRNRVRRSIGRDLSMADKKAALSIWRKQAGLKHEIDTQAADIIESLGEEYSRYFFINSDPVAAMELLRALVVTATGSSPTRPQLERGLLVVKTAHLNNRFRLGSAWLYFTMSSFSLSVKTP